MKKEENISFLLSLVINIIILLLIPALSNKSVENQKIKIGLVAYETKNRMKIEGNKNSNTSEKKTTEKVDKKQEKPVTKPTEKLKPKDEVKKVTEVKESKPIKKDDKKLDINALNALAGTISSPKVSTVSKPITTNKNGFREISTLETPKKEFGKVQGGITSKSLSENITLSKEEIVGEERLNLNDTEAITFNSELGKDSEFDRIFQVVGEQEGLPSGYKLGTEDGNIIARWDNSNKEPIYPENAQLKGLHGVVKIRMNIDENGNVLTLKLEKGSGVPEINRAIEEVGRTWKIYLSKNGLNVKGDVILEYNFTLKGKN